MAYTKTVWKDYPDTTTKMTAQELNNIEDGIEEVDTKVVTLDTSLSDGWVSANETWVYASVDNPTGVITISGNVTTKYSLGMRIKFTNATNVIYGIITAISYSSPNTTMTFLHEINPTNSLALHLMTNSAITNNYYSSMKAPFGFPLSENKWSVLFTSLTTNYTNTPVNNTWYNNNSIVLSVPIGLWELGYACFARSRITLHSTTPYIDTFVTLSTTNNSETLPQYTVLRTSYFGGLGNTLVDSDAYYNISYQIQMTSKTNVYLLEKYASNVVAATIGFAGGNSPTRLRAICAYL